MVGFEDVLVREAREWGFDEDVIEEFFKPLGKYLDGRVDEVPVEWIEKCKKLDIMSEDGKIILFSEVYDLEFMMLGLVWKGWVKRIIQGE